MLVQSYNLYNPVYVNIQSVYTKLSTRTLRIRMRMHINNLKVHIFQIGMFCFQTNDQTGNVYILY